jgi:hypothetical protein
MPTPYLSQYVEGDCVVGVGMIRGGLSGGPLEALLD